MNRVTKRTWLIVFFLAALLAGMSAFVFEYAVHAQEWVAFPGSPHIYNGGNLGCGTVTDRSGVVLLEVANDRSYSDNSNTRRSTLHWLGDRKGNISAGAVSHYTGMMAGYDPINGLYNYTGVGGVEKLTISARIQNTALAALNGQKGTAAVYNYETGEILCAVTSPTFDPDNVPDISGDATGAYEGVYLNRFLRSSYVPGSIFKVVTTSAALECVPDILEKTFTCTGEYSYGTESVTCEHAHGTLDIKGALASSCNCCFAQIAPIVGKSNMEKYVKRFGVTDSVEFDGVKSAAGNYNITDTGGASFAWSCIGQHSDLVNPCAFMTFMGAIASGGQGAEPYIVASVKRGEDYVYEAETSQTPEIMSSNTAETIQSFMRNNVMTVYGDGNFPGLRVCAKSGTSQLGGEQKSNAMFAGFVMNEEYPLAFVVVVENGGYGSAACVPVLSAILAECKSVMDGN